MGWDECVKCSSWFLDFKLWKVNLMNVQVLAKFPLLQALDWAQYKLLLPHHHQTTSVEKKTRRIGEWWKTTLSSSASSKIPPDNFCWEKDRRGVIGWVEWWMMKHDAFLKNVCYPFPIPGKWQWALICMSSKVLEGSLSGTFLTVKSANYANNHLLAPVMVRGGDHVGHHENYSSM